MRAAGAGAFAAVPRGIQAKPRAGTSTTITYVVTVNSAAPAGVTQVSNTATVADDGSNGTDPTPLPRAAFFK